MLDAMVLAVNEGLSYDGIVSIPEVGLEDSGRRPGLAARLEDGMVRLLFLLLTTTTDGSCGSGAASFVGGGYVNHFSCKSLSQEAC